MFVDRYVPKTNERFILLNYGAEKIVDEKTITSIHPHVLNEKMALFGLWARPQFLAKPSRAKIQPN